MPARGPSPFVAIILAGAFTGVGDTLLTLAASPDPGLLTYQLSYVFGPVLLALVWAAPTGAIGAEVARWRGGSIHAMAGTAAGTILLVWVASLVVDGWHAGQAVPSLAVLTLGLTLAAVALARLAVDASGWIGTLSSRARRATAAAAGLVLCGGVLAGTPRGTSSFRGGAGPCTSSSPGTGVAGVVLVTVDALRTDDARTMRSYRRLAAAGREFRQHVTTSPWTLPSIASLLTGRVPAEHGAGRSLSSRSLVQRTPLRAGVETLAGTLGAHGWATHAVVTNPYLTARYGIDRGFCTFENVSMEGEALRALRTTTQLRFTRAVAGAWLPRTARRRSARAPCAGSTSTAAGRSFSGSTSSTRTPRTATVPARRRAWCSISSPSRDGEPRACRSAASR